MQTQMQTQTQTQIKTPTITQITITQTQMQIKMQTDNPRRYFVITLLLFVSVNVLKWNKFVVNTNYNFCYS